MSSCNYALFLLWPGIKKKKKHKKKSKRRHGSVSSISSDSGHTKTKMAKLDEIVKHSDSKSFDILEKDSKNDVTKLNDQSHIKEKPDAMDNIADGTSSPPLPPISKKTDDESDGPMIPKLFGMYSDNNFYIIFTLISFASRLDVFNLLLYEINNV